MKQFQKSRLCYISKRRDNIKVNDIRPIFDPLIKLSTNSMSPLLLTRAGMMSVIRVCSWNFSSLFETKGRLGISVKRKRHVGGIDIIKL